MLNEDLAQTLYHYKPSISDWSEDMVKNGDFLQGHKYITDTIATDKAMRVIKFFTGLGLW